MSDHYYTEQPNSEVKTVTQHVRIKRNDLTLTMSSGVFSKKGIDFGTRTLIEAFNAPDVAGDFLDLGCGYGPIGIVLAKENPERTVVMVDVNERAQELSRQNATRNGVRNIEVFGGSGFDRLQTFQFAAVITNPPIRAGKKVIYQMLQDAYNQLVDGGMLWVVIQKKQGAPSLIRFLESVFREVKEIDRKKGYFIICAEK